MGLAWGTFKFDAYYKDCMSCSHTAYHHFPAQMAILGLDTHTYHPTSWPMYALNRSREADQGGYRFRGFGSRQTLLRCVSLRNAVGSEANCLRQDIRLYMFCICMWCIGVDTI